MHSPSMLCKHHAYIYYDSETVWERLTWSNGERLVVSVREKTLPEGPAAGNNATASKNLERISKAVVEKVQGTCY